MPLRLSRQDLVLKIVIALLSVCVLSACASRDIGLPTSDVLGLAPETKPQTGAEAVLGAMMDGPSARVLDRRDKSLMSDAIIAALKSPSAGTPQTWKNLLSGHSGSVTPGPVYAVNDLSCRDYVQAITISGHDESQRATACQQADGSWRTLM